MSSPSQSPPPTHLWSYDLRRWVIIGLVVGGMIFLYFIRETLPVLVLSLLVAYLLNPVVSWLVRRLRLPRLAAIALVYVVVIAVLIELSILIAPNLFRQVTTLVDGFDTLVVQLLALGRQLPIVANWTAQLEPSVVAQQLRAEALVLIEQSPRFLAGAASSLLSVLITIVLSIYLLRDADAFINRIDAAIPAAYRGDFERIMRELDQVWSGFLRGQVLLSVIIAIVTTAALLLLGVRGAFLLGLLAGILEVVPTIGPILAMIPAVFIGYLQGSTLWAIDNTVFAIIIILTYTAIQQLENHILVPNVLGASVKLPPVLILAGTIVGASLAGVLGIFLAAPILATARLFFGFVFAKLFEPLPGSSDEQQIPGPAPMPNEPAPRKSNARPIPVHERKPSDA